MNNSDQLVIRENYGLTPYKQALVPFLIAITVLIMHRVNSPDESATFSYVISGIFFLLGTIAFTFRRSTLFDQPRKMVTTRWNILFYKYKEEVPYSHITGLELSVGIKREGQRISSGEYVQRYLRLKLNCEGVDGPADEDYKQEIYTSQDHDKALIEAQKIVDFLGVKLEVIDHRLGIDKMLDRML